MGSREGGAAPLKGMYWVAGWEGWLKEPPVPPPVRLAPLGYLRTPDQIMFTKPKQMTYTDSTRVVSKGTSLRSANAISCNRVPEWR